MSFKSDLTEAIAEFYDDPLGYVMFNWPWDTDPSIQVVKLAPRYAERFGMEYGPDEWACMFLDDLGHEIRQRGFDGSKAVDPIRFSTASGHGIGKSTLSAWLVMFILDTRPYSKGVVTANTSDQLRTKTWAELAKWHKLALTKEFWNYASGRGSMSLSRVGDKNVAKTWRCDAYTCRPENAESFQGLHAANSTAFYIFDESSGIEEPIWEARYGGATDGEPMSFDFGNPTRKSGHFFENTAGMFRHRYITRSIDSRDVAITNKKLIEEWKEDWGEDSDLFKVKVRGVFPSAGSVQFIGTDLVRGAMDRTVVTSRNDPLIIGVDVARFGDNNTVIYPRIGMDAASFPYQEYNGLDQVQVAEKVIETLQYFQGLGRKCNGLFIDGGGLGSGPIDILRRCGWDAIDVNFGTAASDKKYGLRVDEMWGRLRDALPRLALPKNDATLLTQMTQREYAFNENSGKIRLETKKSMATRQVASPDIVDALALTFATPVGVSVDVGLEQFNRTQVQHEYDPFREAAANG